MEDDEFLTSRQSVLDIFPGGRYNLRETIERSRIMNKSLKRILPILLVLIVLGSVVWYMFVYDRDFTRDMLLKTARYFERHGDQGTAATFYDWAYKHSNNDEAVALELAQQFRNNGNYTKAEYTLTKAIANGGSVELYLALSKLYVEQNKLLDAVTMLENIPDENVKQQIDSLRPAAPTASPTPGTYNQYKTVTISCPSGKLYATTDGSYPSADNGVFSGNTTLAGGENTIRALAVGENGLVSKLQAFYYVVGGVIEEIEFVDPQVDALVRQYLNKDADDPIMSNELWNITSLVLPAGLHSLSDLQYFPYLQVLSIQKSNYESLQILSKLTYLKGVSVIGCSVTESDLSAIAGLPNLTTLVLAECGLTNITPLSTATKLEMLDLHGNTIQDLTPLQGMEKLHTLNLAQNALSDLTPIAGLPALATLSVAGNSLTTLAPLSTVTTLTALDASTNMLTDLSGVETLTALIGLYAFDNDLTNISAVETLTGLQELNVSNNSLTNITCLGKLTNLLYLNFNNNQVKDLPKWPTDAALVTIEGSYNKITSVNNLSGLENLNNVILEHNQLTKIDALKDCHLLVKVNVFGNKVKNVSVLTDMGVIVIRNPQ